MTRSFTPEDRKKWREAAKDSDISNRTLRRYQSFLRIPDEDLQNLRGKTIIDIGSVSNQMMHRELQEKCPDINLITTTLHKRRGVTPKVPTAMMYAQELGLGDETVDEIWALFSVPHYLPDVESLRATLEGFVRILKRGGKARIAPVEPAFWVAAEPGVTREDIEKALNAIPGISWEIPEPEGMYPVLIIRKL